MIKEEEEEKLARLIVGPNQQQDRDAYWLELEFLLSQIEEKKKKEQSPLKTSHLSQL